MTEADLLAVLQALTGRSLASEIQSWVHSTAELPLKPLLEAAGVQVLEEPAQLAQALGLRAQEAAGIVVKTVLRGGAAEAAGFAAGDEWLAVQVGSARWRIHKLDEIPLYVGTAPVKVKALVSRDKRLLELPLHIPAGQTTWRMLLGGGGVGWI